jgi:uncharacterized membrane protein YfcA
MPGIVSNSAQLHSAPKRNVRIAWLQGVTLAWMVVELGVSGYAAAAAHSPAMLAFSSDSFVELLSALVVLLQWVPKLKISERKTARIAAALLFCLSAVVAVTALATFVLRLQPETSLAGVSITLAALVVMTVLAWLKRRDARRLVKARTQKTSNSEGPWALSNRSSGGCLLLCRSKRMKHKVAKRPSYALFSRRLVSVRFLSLGVVTP